MEEILPLFDFTGTKFFIFFYFLFFFLFPFAILGFLFSKSLEREPSFLIGIDRMKGMKNAWTLLLVITAPLVFIYNTFVWAGWAFVIIAEFIASIFNKIYHFLIVHFINALKWLYKTLKIEFWWKVPKWIFMNIIWMPTVFTAKFVYHYTIKWGWDLYLTSFQSIKGTYNYDKLKVGFKGAFYTLFILGVSIYLAELFEQETIAFVGLLLSVLPTLNSIGIITSMNHFDDGKRDHAAHGKKVMKASKVRKHITFHSARHTFATTVTLSNGVPIETVSKLLGHTKLSTTQIYARVMENKISSDMSNLEKRMAKKERKDRSGRSNGTNDSD